MQPANSRSDARAALAALDERQIARLDEIARMVEGLQPHQTVTCTPAGAHYEYRIKVKLTYSDIISTLVRFPPDSWRVTAQRFANDEVLLYIVPLTAPPLAELAR